MKPFFALILILLLTGCAAASMTQVQNAPTPEAVELPLVEMAPQEEVIRYETEIRLCSGEHTINGQVCLVSYLYDQPYLYAFREDGTLISDEDGSPVPEAKQAAAPVEEKALAVTQVFNGNFDTAVMEEEAATLAEAAQEDLEWRQAEGLEWHDGYALELECTLYQTEHMVSVSGLYYSNTGGAHPNTWLLGWNFDLDTGTFFDPKLLGDDTGLQEAVAAEIIRQAGEPMEDGTTLLEWYWEDYEAIISDWSSYAVSFDETGMTVAFSPYELAPYAAGAQEFHFSYDWLEPYLGGYGRTLLGMETAE